MATKHRPEVGKSPAHGDKVFVAGREGPLRVIGFTEVAGERAMVLASSGDVQGEAHHLRLKHGCVPRATVPVADVVRDIPRRGWRQRWTQGEMELDDHATQPDVS